jgi:hypothetical protein
MGCAAMENHLRLPCSGIIVVDDDFTTAAGLPFMAVVPDRGRCAECRWGQARQGWCWDRARAEWRGEEAAEDLATEPEQGRGVVKRRRPLGNLDRGVLGGVSVLRIETIAQKR